MKTETVITNRRVIKIDLRLLEASMNALARTGPLGQVHSNKHEQMRGERREGTWEQRSSLT